MTLELAVLVFLAAAGLLILADAPLLWGGLILGGVMLLLGFLAAAFPRYRSKTWRGLDGGE